MNKNLQTLMTTCISIGTAETLVTLGIHSGEISMRKARDVYGKWFIDAVNNGRLFPCRVDVKGKVDFPQIGFEKGTTERGFSKVSKSV